MSREPPDLHRDVPLAEMTTLGVGGPARYVASGLDESALRRVLAWAQHEAMPTLVLGGGSNILASDRGFDGVIVRPEPGQIRASRAGDAVRLSAGGGQTWDDLVAWAVERQLAGVECLSGIPGLVGAAPIQNIGAYGQEVGDVIEAVRCVDRSTGDVVVVRGSECAFGYRASRFLGEWADRYVVTGVDLLLRPGGAPALGYGELRARVDASGGGGLSAVRRAVLAIRREKSMVFDTADPNHRSAGSFFVNPIVSGEAADAAAEVAGRRGADPSTMPRYPAGDGRMKLSAAWLIERAGFGRGYGAGPVGLSTRHTLAIVNRGGAQAADILALAREIRAGVHDVFGVLLSPEPVFVGFDAPASELLGGAGASWS